MYHHDDATLDEEVEVEEARRALDYEDMIWRALDKRENPYELMERVS